MGGCANGEKAVGEGRSGQHTEYKDHRGSGRVELSIREFTAAQGAARRTERCIRGSGRSLKRRSSADPASYCRTKTSRYHNTGWRCIASSRRQQRYRSARARVAGKPFECGVNTARGSERNNKTAAVDNKPAAPASPETAAGALQTGVEPTSAEYAEYALRNRLPLQNVRGGAPDHRADAFYVKAVDRLSIRGKSISGGENQNLTLLKGATMRVPLLLGGVYKFGSKEAPVITYQGTVIPEATVLQSWFRFIPAPAR